MPVKVRCPGCKKALNAPDKARGKVLKCPQCETKIRIPAGEGAEPPSSRKKVRRSSEDQSSRKTRKPQSSTSLLANLDLSKAEAKGIRICPRCHAEIDDPEMIDCEECGADLDTGGLGTIERKRQSIKGVDPKKYYKGTVSDGWKFYKSNKRLTILTCLSLSITTAIQFVLIFLSLLCVGIPPKIILNLTAFVCGMVPYGWIWVLSLEIMANTITNKPKMHKVNFDFFLSSSMGLKFWTWLIIFPIPFYFISAGLYVWFKYMNFPMVGLSMVFIALSMAVMLAPIAAAHLTMPITYRAWLVNHELNIFFQKPGPLVYWFAVLLLTITPAIAGFTYVGVAHGSEIRETLHNVSENTIIAAAKEYEIPALGDPDKRMMEYKDRKELPVDLNKLIVPFIVTISSVFWIGLVAVFNMRTAGRYAFLFQKELGLIKQAKEVTYVRNLDEDGEEIKSQVRTVYLLDMVHFMAFFAWGLLKGPFLPFATLGLVTSLIWIPIGGLWRIFEKAKYNPQAALFPPLAAIYWARMADESDAKGLLLLLPPVNIYFGIKMSITIAKKFNKSKGYGIALALLFPIMLTVLGSDPTARYKKKL